MKLVILIDSINTNKTYLMKEWPGVVEMFSALFEKVEEVMVMELTADRGINVIQPFTSDKEALQKLIADLKGELWKDIDKAFMRLQMEELKREAALSVKDRFVINPLETMEFLEAEEKYPRRLRLAKSLSAYLSSVNYIRKIEGIKSVLLISDGFHLDYELGVRKKELISSHVKVFDPFGLFGNKKHLDQLEAFEKFIKLINEERIIFYAFSPKGLKPEFSMLLPQSEDIFQEEKEQWARERYTVEKLATETGGLYLGGEKKYQNFVEELESDLGQFYDISYEPMSGAGYHKIEVRVKRPGVTVRHRKGYSALTEKDVENRNIASAFLSPSYYKEIYFACLTDAVCFQKGSYQFWVRIHIPLDQFKLLKDLPPDKISLLFGIIEPQAEKVHQGEVHISIRKAVENGLENLAFAFLTSAMELKPKEYELRVILKGEENKIGGWEESITIPDRRKGPECFLMNSILGDLRKEEKQNPLPFSISPKDGSLLLSRYTLYPSAHEIFRAGGRAGLFLQVVTPRDRQSLAFGFCLKENGKESFDLSSERVESFYDEKTGILNGVYLLVLPDVPSGDYRLEIKSPHGLEKNLDLKIALRPSFSS
jgi:VWFA-related protein